MKLKNVLIALVLGGVAVGGAVWFGNYSGSLPDAKATTDANPTEDPYLKLAGPPPKAVVDSLIHDFDAMERGTEGEHIFNVRNEGEGVLRLLRGQPTCTCTKFMINDDKDLKRLELKKGESAKVTVAWKVKGKDPHFKSEAPIHTNDPDNKYLPFSIQGKVVYSFFVHPTRTWIAPDVVDDKPVYAVGVVGSRLIDNFEIESVETDSEYLEIEKRKLESKPGELDSIDAKCAYQFDVKISPNIPVGHFRADVRAILKKPDGTTIPETFEVVTSRGGPMRVVGPGFDNKSMTLDLKSFDINQGKTEQVSMFVNTPNDDDLDFDIVESTNENVKLHIERDKNFKGQGTQRYLLKFEIPAGAIQEPENRGRAEFVVKTTHPELESIRFRVKYNAF